MLNYRQGGPSSLSGNTASMVRFTAGDDGRGGVPVCRYQPSTLATAASARTRIVSSIMGSLVMVHHVFRCAY
jgi:hypothetical protein